MCHQTIRKTFDEMKSKVASLPNKLAYKQFLIWLSANHIVLPQRIVSKIRGFTRDIGRVQPQILDRDTPLRRSNSNFDDYNKPVTSVITHYQLSKIRMLNAGTFSVINENALRFRYIIAYLLDRRQCFIRSDASNSCSWKYTFHTQDPDPGHSVQYGAISLANTDLSMGMNKTTNPLANLWHGFV